MSQKSGAAQYGQPSGRGIFFPLANTSEIRPKEQIKKDFHESFIDLLFSPPSFCSPFPIANISSSLDSDGIFTLFSAKHYGKLLLRVIFSGTLCSLPTCWLCDLFYCLRKCWVKFGRDMGAVHCWRLIYWDPSADRHMHLVSSVTDFKRTHNIKAGTHRRAEAGTRPRRFPAAFIPCTVSPHSPEIVDLFVIGGFLMSPLKMFKYFFLHVLQEVNIHRLKKKK